MPTDKKKTAAEKAAEKKAREAKRAANKKKRQTKRTKVGGVRRVKASTKVAKAADRSFAKSTAGKKNQRARSKAAIRSDTRSQTASNLKKTGTKQAKTGVKEANLKDQIVTPRSAQKKRYDEQQARGYMKAAGMKKKWKDDLTPKAKKKKKKKKR